MNKKSELKETYFHESAQMFKLLSSPLRLKLLNYISFCPRTVESCAEKFEQSVQNTSLHLRAMAKAGILGVERLKNFRIYSLADSRALDIIASEIGSSQRALLNEGLACNLDQTSLAQAAANNEIYLVDLRSPEESAFIPVTRAQSFTGEIAQIKSFLVDLRPAKPVVFFCRGSWCERMASVVEKAARLGCEAKGLGLSAKQLSELDQEIKAAL